MKPEKFELKRASEVKVNSFGEILPKFKFGVSGVLSIRDRRRQCPT